MTVFGRVVISVVVVVDVVVATILMSSLSVF